MKLYSIKNFIYTYIFICIYSKNQINAKNCCCKNKYIKEDKKEINDFGGVKGLIGILENNKVSFNINTSFGLKKIAETVEDYNGEFNYENVKKLKIKLLGIELDPETIEKYISDFSDNLKGNEKKSFFKGKLTKLIYKTDNKELLIYDFNDSRYYYGFSINLEGGGNVFGYVNYNNQTKKCLEYGVLIYHGLYFKYNVNTRDVFWEPDKQEEYKKCFLEGK